jgi:hypothetical protein
VGTAHKLGKGCEVVGGRLRWRECGEGDAKRQAVDSSADSRHPHGPHARDERAMALPGPPRRRHPALNPRLTGRPSNPGGAAGAERWHPRAPPRAHHAA